ncbi:MAG: SDR family oxidoreductase [Gammaproteobacteria bacterium]|nr:SDR family oxidoreductase [Gammaproteobacteria bacterium]
MNSVDRHLFCFGCGYSAIRLAHHVLAAGGRVSGTSRSVEGAARLERLGITAHRFDGSSSLPATAFAEVTDMLTSIPPGAGGDDGVLAHHGKLLAHLDTLQWSAVLSTTGVYGDVGGAWIDENAPLQPGTERAARRVSCERRWLDWSRANNKPVQVFRLPGIYGPGRSPFVRLRAGTAQRLIKPGQVFNRIHVDDIARALMLAMRNPEVGPVFHLADGEPAAADVVLEYAAALLGLSSPPAVQVEEAEISPMARQFYSECKRLSTARAQSLLGFTPLFPSYREGLAAVLAEEGDDTVPD